MKNVALIQSCEKNTEIVFLYYRKKVVTSIFSGGTALGVRILSEVPVPSSVSGGDSPWSAEWIEGASAFISGEFGFRGQELMRLLHSSIVARLSWSMQIIPIADAKISTTAVKVIQPTGEIFFKTEKAILN